MCVSLNHPSWLCMFACGHILVDFAFKYFTKTNLVHAWNMWGLLPECSIGDPDLGQLKLKHTWQLTSGLCFYQPSTAGHSQAVQIWTVVKVTSGKSHGINGTVTHKRQKLSSCFQCKAYSMHVYLHQLPGLEKIISASIWDTWLSLVRTCVLKFGLNSRLWQILLYAMTNYKAN